MSRRGRPRAQVGRTSTTLSLPAPLLDLWGRLGAPKNLSAFVAANLEVYYLQLLDAERSAEHPRKDLIGEIVAALEESGQERRTSDAVGAALAAVRNQGIREIVAASNASQRDRILIGALRQVLPTNADRMALLSSQIEDSVPRIQEKVAAICGETPTAVEIIRYCSDETAAAMNRDEGRGYVG